VAVPPRARALKFCNLRAHPENDTGTAHVSGALILKLKIIKADAADYAKTDSSDTGDSAVAVDDQIHPTVDLWFCQLS
jgi:hypothetical protein